MCEGGVAIWKRSSLPSPRAATQWSVPAEMDRCVWRTALGWAVVPELKTKSASSSAATSTLGGRSGSKTAAEAGSSRSSTCPAPMIEASRPTPPASAMA